MDKFRGIYQIFYDLDIVVHLHFTKLNGIDLIGTVLDDAIFN